jgi:hypothetical protein
MNGTYRLDLKHSPPFGNAIKTMVEDLKKCKDLSWFTHRAPSSESDQIGELKERRRKEKYEL